MDAKNQDQFDAELPKEYKAPQVKKMSEEEILEAFQVTSASISWWIM